MGDWDAIDAGGAPICAACGVTALPAEDAAGFVCENPDCEAFGEAVQEHHSS